MVGGAWGAVLTIFATRQAGRPFSPTCQKPPSVSSSSAIGWIVFFVVLLGSGAALAFFLCTGGAKSLRGGEAVSEPVAMDSIYAADDSGDSDK